MPIGTALSILGCHRAMEWERFKSEEIRARRLGFFASATIDQSGKTPSDLYPFPWEGKQREPATFEEGMVAMKGLQEQLNKKRNAVKKVGTGKTGD